MGYLLWSSLRSDSSETGTITVHPIWKDGFAVCLSEISAVDVKGKSKHRFLGGGVGGRGERFRERARGTIPKECGRTCPALVSFQRKSYFQAFPHGGL